MGKYTYMHAVEVQHAKRWHNEDGMTLEQIGKLLKRCPKTIKKHVLKKSAGATTRRAGRPALSDKEYAKCEKALTSLQKEPRLSARGGVVKCLS